MLCWVHHKGLHRGDFSIEGNPEDGALRFLNRWGRPIEPPDTGPPGPCAEPTEVPVFTPPTGEPLDARWFAWN